MNDAPVLVEWNANVAVVELVELAGPLSIRVSMSGAAAAGMAMATRTARTVPTTASVEGMRVVRASAMGMVRRYSTRSAAVGRESSSLT